MDNLKQLFSRLSAFLSSLKLWQKVSLFAAAFVVLAFLVGAVLWSKRTTYELLYSKLDVDDQASIVAYLRENKIQYQIDSVANAILVPKDQVDDAKLALAQEGLPRGGGVGFDVLFDKQKIGSSEFEKGVAYTRAVEGELQRTISQMDVVESARVRIVVPKPQLFLEQRDPSRASVMVRLKPGARLMPNQVKAIVFLVSRSVEGLEPENITLVDTSGRILSDMVSDDWIIYGLDGKSGVMSVQMELERKLEKDLENNIRNVLGPVYGRENVTVVVKAELDFNKKDSSMVEYLPYGNTGAGLTRSKETSEENYTGDSAVVRNSPGTTTNIPGYDVNRGQTVRSEYNNAKTTTNVELSKRQSSEVATPGSIKRLTASVVLNRDEMSDEDLAMVKSLVGGAMSYVEARGDNIVVNAKKFDKTWVDDLLAEMRRERLMRLVAGVLIALAALACVALAGIWWLRRRRAKMALEDIQKESKHVPTIQEMLTSPDLLAFQGEMAVLEEQLKAYAKNNPAEVANLVNEWISADV